MVIGGAENCGLGSVVDGLAGHPAAFDACVGGGWADGAAVVVDVVVVGAVVDLAVAGRRSAQEMPTTTTATAMTR